jgi:hypothetical protein
MTKLLSSLAVCTTLFFLPSKANHPGYATAVQPNSGCIKGDCFNGYGTFLYTNGNRYVGDFRQGDPHGRGILYFANGNKYLGNWQKSYREGDGKFIFNEGHEYTGQFRQNQFHGKGIMAYNNGDTYDGDWKNNRPNGLGKYIFHSGDRYVGLFLNGKFDGEGTMFYKDGSKYTGSWRNSRKHGWGTFYDASGNKHPGEWSNGSPLNPGNDDHQDEQALEVLVSDENEHPPAEAPDDNFQTEKIPESSVRIWAIVVGVATYTHMPSLRYTDDDAYQFYAFLKSPEGGALPDNQVKVLIDETATRDNVLNSLRNTLSKADENDVVLFYFSGHGVEGAFIPVDFDGYDHRLYHEEIKTIIEQSRAKHKLVLGDACHSGTLFAAEYQQDLLASRTGVQSMLEKYYKAFENSKGGIAFLMSSRGQEVSLEDSGFRSGVFSHYLIKGLKGEADLNGNKMVTLQELFAFVQKRVGTYTAGAQFPVLTGKFDRNMPVSTVR